VPNEADDAKIEPVAPVAPIELIEYVLPNEADDAEMEEHSLPQIDHSERTATRERSEYTSLREDQKDTLSQRHSYTVLKASNFASNPDILETYRVPRYNNIKWKDWKSAVEMQMREFDIHCDWVNLLKSLGRLTDGSRC
jgi:hypothetical protein